MANVVRRDSGRWQVRWRDGGTRQGKQQSEWFYVLGEANRFAAAVEEAGQQWPPEWDKVRRCWTWELPKEQTPEPVAEHKLYDAGLELVRLFTDAGPLQKTRYEQQLRILQEEFTEILDAVATVEAIETEHIMLWINKRKAMKVGGSPKTIRNYHGLLFMVMSYAVHKGWRSTNPCTTKKRAGGLGYSLPKAEEAVDDEIREGKVFLDEGQFDLVYSCLDDPDAADFIATKVGTGIRFGEITALKVTDCDDLLDERKMDRIHVRRTWKRNGRGEFRIAKYGHYYIGLPKGKKKRRITVSPTVADILRRHCQGKAKTDLVFTAPRGGRIDHGHFWESRWKPAVEKAQELGLSVWPRLHDLRHTHAAWLISAGVPLPVIQQRLGHESITMTVDIYGGLLDQPHEVADAAIEAALTGGRIARPGPALPPNAPVVLAADEEVAPFDPDDDIVLDDEDDNTSDDD